MVIVQKGETYSGQKLSIRDASPMSASAHNSGSGLEKALNNILHPKQSHAGRQKARNEKKQLQEKERIEEVRRKFHDLTSDAGPYVRYDRRV